MNRRGFLGSVLALPLALKAKSAPKAIVLREYQVNYQTVNPYLADDQAWFILSSKQPQRWDLHAQ